MCVSKESPATSKPTPEEFPAPIGLEGNPALWCKLKLAKWSKTFSSFLTKMKIDILNIMLYIDLQYFLQDQQSVVVQCAHE